MKSLLLVTLLAVFYIAGVSSSVLMKKGNCPLVYESDHDCKRKFDLECLLDFDCNNTMKCCRTACHQHRCIEPLRNKVCHRNSDIAFVLDASGSIGKESFKNMKNTIKKLLESFSYEKGHRHAMVVYGGKPSIVFNHVAELSVNERTADLIKTVDEIPFYGSPVTRINAALQLVRQEVFPRYKNQDHRTKMIVLFTDGIQSTPPYQEGLIEAGKVLDKEDIKVFGVLTGKERNMNSLLNLCTNDQFIFEREFLPELIEIMNHEMEYYC